MIDTYLKPVDDNEAIDVDDRMDLSALLRIVKQHGLIAKMIEVEETIGEVKYRYRVEF